MKKSVFRGFRKIKEIYRVIKQARKEMKALHKLSKTKKFQEHEKLLRSLTKEDWDNFAVQISRKRLRLKRHPLEKTLEKAGLLESRKATKARVWKADATPKTFKIKRRKK